MRAVLDGEGEAGLDGLLHGLHEPASNVPGPGDIVNGFQALCEQVRRSAEFESGMESYIADTPLPPDVMATITCDPDAFSRPLPPDDGIDVVTLQDWRIREALAQPDQGGAPGKRARREYHAGRSSADDERERRIRVHPQPAWWKEEYHCASICPRTDGGILAACLSKVRNFAQRDADECGKLVQEAGSRLKGSSGMVGVLSATVCRAGIPNCVTVALAVATKLDDWPTVEIGEAALLVAPPPERASASVVFIDCPDRDQMMVLTGGINMLLTRGSPLEGPLVTRAMGYIDICPAFARMEECGWFPNRVLFPGVRQPARTVLNFLIEHATIMPPMPRGIRIDEIRGKFSDAYREWAKANVSGRASTSTVIDVFSLLGHVHRACVTGSFGCRRQLGRSLWKSVWSFPEAPIRFITIVNGRPIHNDSKAKDEDRFNYKAGHKVVPFLLNGSEVQFFASLGEPMLNHARASARNALLAALDGSGVVTT